MTGLRTRLAPTPSGYLHLGNAYSFILTWVICRTHGGTLRLRIDDLDAARTRDCYIEDIFASLDWLGIDYDEGPMGPEDHRRRFSQALRRDEYQTTLDQLAATGRVFACGCSRREIHAAPAGRHPASCLEANRPLDSQAVAWRVRTDGWPPVEWQDVDHVHRRVALDVEMTDFVVRRKDTVAAYQVASLSDDLAQQINFIVRGEDLLASTAAQRMLARVIGGDAFLETRFLHHRLLPDPQGGKLSKSAGASSLRAMRAERSEPADLYRQLSSQFGVEPVGSLRELRDAVSFDWTLS